MLTSLSLAGCVAYAEETVQEPKYIDLHKHLDGSITVDIAKKLAELQGIALPTDNDEELKDLLTVSPDCKDLNEFLDRFELPVSLLQTPEGLSEAVYLVMEDCKATGDIYAEIRFAPQLHCENGMTQEDAINAALEGLKRSDLCGNLILCCMRGENNEEENMETVELAKKYLVEDGGVVALDIAGAEALYPTENYRELFAKAREYNIPFTIHAGEADGAESVRLAIEYGASRIGHGVRIYEDSEVMELARDNGIFLEMCPTSNSQTRAIDNMEEYPLKDYLHYGIKVTLNTDDSAIEDTDIGSEYDYIRKNFGLSDSEVLTLLANAVDAAFTSYEVKCQLREELGLPYVPEENAEYNGITAEGAETAEAGSVFDEKHLVIIDTDTAGDDAMAIAMMAKAPNVEVLGVTVLPGNVSLEQ